MSRCYCCDTILSTQEACAKFKGSGEYTEMCNKCIKAAELTDVVVRPNKPVDDEAETDAGDSEFIFSDDADTEEDNY